MFMNIKDEILAMVIDAPDGEQHDGEVFFDIPNTFFGFQGHFPDNPVMPGIFQIMIGQIAIEMTQNSTLKFSMIKRTKFIKQVLPNSIIKVKWRESVADDMVTYMCKLSVSDVLVSSFKLCI